MCCCIIPEWLYICLQYIYSSPTNQQSDFNNYVFPQTSTSVSLSNTTVPNFVTTLLGPTNVTVEMDLNWKKTVEVVEVGV